MPKEKLTPSFIRKINSNPESDERIQRATGKTKQVIFWDSLAPGSEPGLGLRVSWNGKGAPVLSWVVSYHIHGRERRKTLPGRYPELSLKDAREEARRIRGTARKTGRDVFAEAESQQEQTFSAVRDRFLKQYVWDRDATGETELKPRTIHEYERFLHRPELAPWENVPMRRITSADVEQLLAKVYAENKEDPKKSKGVTRNRMLAYLRKMMNWCVEKTIIETPPTLNFKMKTEQPRDRVLSDDEIVTAWRAFGVAGAFEPVLKLMLLLGQRESETAGIEWADLHGLNTSVPVWILPKTKTKNKKPHAVPLPELAATILRSVPPVDSPYVFTTKRTKYSKPVASFGRVKKRIDERCKELTDAESAPGWRLHDLRRTVQTRLNQLGIAPHVADMVLNHLSAAKPGMQGVYNRYDYLKEKREALALWSAYLEELLRAHGIDPYHLHCLAGREVPN